MEEINNSSNSYNSNNSKNSNNIPEPRSSAVVLNLGSNRFFLFGGGSREKTFNDFWILLVKKNQNQAAELKWVDIAENNVEIPNSRFGSAGCVTKDKINQNLYTLYIHGGQNFFENKIFGDMLIIKLSETLENSNNFYKIVGIENITTYPIDIKTTPIQRNSHCMVTFNEDLYIFGGGSSDGLLNDLWQFNITTKKWHVCEIGGKTIPSREMHGMVVYTNKKNENYLYIFGGRLLESIDDKIYRVNLSDFKCEYVTNIPIALCSFSYVLYKYFIIIYGGTDGNTFLNDIIIFNITNSKWAKSKFQIHSELVKSDPNLAFFLGRIGSSMSIDYDSEQLLIFGGSSIHKDTNYTCVLKLKDLFDENNLTPC
jgi:hypothetical protein